VSGWLLATVLALLAIADFLVLLAAYTLRDFSRGRLDDICKERGREDRFGQILKDDEDAQLLTELAAALLTAALIGLAIFEFGFFILPDGDWWDWMLYAASAVVFALALVAFTVVLPWTLARVTGEAYLFRTWPAISGALRMFRPLLVPVRRFDHLMHRLVGVEHPESGEYAGISEEIRSVVDEGQREGLLESEARTMIHRVMELREVETGSIMTPRTDMICIRAEATLEEARELLLQAGHSRIPVIGESTDDIIGILYAKDLLRYVNIVNGQPVALKEIVREPYYVPETTGIDKLLEMMKRERVHVAIVVDEYGGVAGLVSMEDILEEIVGEIVDEYDAAEDTGIVAVSPDIIDVDSRVHIDDLNEQFQLDLPEDADYDTVGGFVFRQLGRVPVNGDQFTWGRLRVTVKKADKRRIHKIRLQRDETLAAHGAEEG
jgi:CBS domain containing-hemolysin-like protein